MDKLNCDSECISFQFNCDCYSQKHSMRVIIGKEEGKVVACTFHFFMVGKAPLFFRVKEAWRLLRGEDAEVLDFALRLEDSAGLINLLSNLVLDSNTASN